MKPSLPVSLTPSPSRRISPLERIRRFSRSAWLLHGYLFAMLVLLPPGRHQLRADEPEEEVWWFDHIESSYQLFLDAPDGTSVTAGTSCTVKVTAQISTWEVWASNFNGIQTRNGTTTPASGGNVTFNVTSGTCSRVPDSGFTAANGELLGNIELASDNVRLEANVAFGASGSASASLDIFTIPTPESWSYTRTEGTLTATLSALATTTGQLPVGGQTQLAAHVQYESWEVWTSNYGNVETRNNATSPAEGASVNWSKTGDGSLSTTTSQADLAGNTAVDFTMGTYASDISVNVSYSSSADTASATLSLSPTGGSGPGEEEWQLDHVEGYISTSLSANGGQDSLASGEQRVITAEVMYTSGEVWTSSFGNIDNRNQTTAPAIGAVVSYAGSGDVSFQGYTGSVNDLGQPITDANGRMTFTMTMGRSNSTVTASASFAAPTSTASMDFTAAPPPPPPPPNDPPPNDPPPNDPPVEIWNFDHTEMTGVGITLSSGSAYVHASTIEVWKSDQNHYRTQNPGSGPAINASISCSVANGDAVITACDSTTNEFARASYSVLGGAIQSTVTVSASFGGMSGSASFTVAPSDSDGDGFSDASEHSAGTDMNDPNSNIDRMPTSPSDPNPPQWIYSDAQQSGTWEEIFGLSGWEYTRTISGGAAPPDGTVVPPGGYTWVAGSAWTIGDCTESYRDTEIYTWAPLRRWVHVVYQIRWIRLAVPISPPV